MISLRVARALLLTAIIALAGCAFLGAAWWRNRGPIDPAQLSPQARQALVQRMISVSAGTYMPTWYEPRLGYVLRPGEPVAAWGDTFHANLLGYRGPAVEKPDGVFRVVLTGDSWTYGFGVRGDESIAAHLQRLVDTESGSARKIEIWPLALAGYNLPSQIAALEYSFQRLEPDAVVVCPTRNDLNSLPGVLPNGSFARTNVVADAFGNTFSIEYRLAGVDSYLFRHRWTEAMLGIESLRVRLEDEGIPLVLHFAAHWEEPFVHHLVHVGGVQAPYVITPWALTQGKWKNPPPYRHGTSEAYGLYARIVYRALASVLDWTPLASSHELADVPVHDPAGSIAWVERSEAMIKKTTMEEIPTTFTPSRSARAQCIGPMNPATGLFGRATGVLVRRLEGARELVIGLRRVRNPGILYPMELRCRIPAKNGGVEIVTTIPRDGPKVHKFVVPIPENIKTDAAMDVLLIAERTTTSATENVARSARLVSIVQR